jgi:hypothetical protein
MSRSHSIFLTAAWPPSNYCQYIVLHSDPSGFHAIGFGYDPATSGDGTIVAGHPAILTLLVDDAGVVGGLPPETDPKARLYIRKKAFLSARRPQNPAVTRSVAWVTNPRRVVSAAMAAVMEIIAGDLTMAAASASRLVRK